MEKDDDILTFLEATEEDNKKLVEFIEESTSEFLEKIVRFY